jgi:hypothetical protein
MSAQIHSKAPSASVQYDAMEWWKTQEQKKLAAARRAVDAVLGQPFFEGPSIAGQEGFCHVSMSIPADRAGSLGLCDQDHKHCAHYFVPIAWQRSNNGDLGIAARQYCCHHESGSLCFIPASSIPSLDSLPYRWNFFPSYLSGADPEDADQCMAMDRDHARAVSLTVAQCKMSTLKIFA